MTAMTISQDAAARRASFPARRNRRSLIRSWWRRAQERRQLAAMSERDRRDIGLTSLDVWRETNKPFWRD
jgi:uncharacterized protein YjiS (DUF1127 family)